MWWMQLIQMAVNMGLDKAEEDAEENRREAYQRMARAEGGAEADLLMEDLARTRGRAATLAAASGGGLTGSALEVLDDLGRQGWFRVRSAIWSAETDAAFGTRVTKGTGWGAAAGAAVPLLSEWSQSWGNKGGGTGSGLGSMMGGMAGGGGAGATSGAMTSGFAGGMGG